MARRKRPAKKAKSPAVRVVAVMHPHSKKTTLRALARTSPYVTDGGLSELFQRHATTMRSDQGRSQLSVADLTKIGGKILEHAETPIPKIAQKIEPKTMAVLFSIAAGAIYKGKYKSTTANPVFAMEAFVACHECGLFPPMWVLEWLNRAFVLYLSSSDGMNLDAFLGVKRKRGQTPAIKEANAVDFEADIMREIGQLTLLRIPIADAAYMVKSRLRQMKINCQSSDTLAERFKRRGWSKIFTELKRSYPDIPLKEKMEYLSAYPK